MLCGKQSPKHHLRRRSVTLGTGRLRPAPDALALARSVAVLAGGRMVAPRDVAHRAAPLATRGIVSVLVLAGRGVMASRAITRRTAVPALRLVLLRSQQSADERKVKRNCRYPFRFIAAPYLRLLLAPTRRHIIFIYHYRSPPNRHFQIEEYLPERQHHLSILSQAPHHEASPCRGMPRNR